MHHSRAGRGVFLSTGDCAWWYRLPMHSRDYDVWRQAAKGQSDIRRSAALNPCTPRQQSGRQMPPRLGRAIAARWNVWVPWVRMLLLRAHHYDASVDLTQDGADFRRFRERHSQYIVAMLRAGTSVRTIRRHRLDDPRLTDDVRAVLVEAAKARQSKAWFRRSEDQRKQDRLRTLIRLGPVVGRDSTRGPDSASPAGDCQPASVVLDRLAVPEAIESVRRQVCEHFYLREMRDPELTVRTNRRSYVLPRQIAMYTARQLTGASLQEIGKLFGGRHHTTVLHSINKIEEMRRSDSALDCAIMRLSQNGVSCLSKTSGRSSSATAKAGCQRPA
jgi:hypothetical protein